MRSSAGMAAWSYHPSPSGARATVAQPHQPFPSQELGGQIGPRLITRSDTAASIAAGRIENFVQGRRSLASAASLARDRASSAATSVK